MILVIEPVRKGIEHQSFNSSLLLVCQQAFPDEPICFYAEAGHLAAVREALPDESFVQFEELQVSDRHNRIPGRIVPDFRASRVALRTAHRHKATLLIFASVTIPILWHITLLSRFYRLPRTMSVLHGGLAEALRRPRYNLVARLLSLRAALVRAPHAMTFAILEQHILETVKKNAPQLARRLVVFPHPLPSGLLGRAAAVQRPPPIKVGLLGLCTPQKGLFTFLKLAEKLVPALDGAMEFRIVGRIHPQALKRAQPYARHLAARISTEPLPRPQFVSEVAQLHYAAFFFDGGHYDATASGVLLDCIALGVPLLGRRHPLLESLAQKAGDIGVLCGSGEEEATLRRLAEEFDYRRHEQQRLNMRSLGEARTPVALANVLRAAFPPHAAPPSR